MKLQDLLQLSDRILVGQRQVGFVKMTVRDPRSRQVLDGYGFRVPDMPRESDPSVLYKWKRCLTYLMSETEATRSIRMAVRIEQSPIPDLERWAYPTRLLHEKAIEYRTSKFSRARTSKSYIEPSLEVDEDQWVSEQLEAIYQNHPELRFDKDQTDKLVRELRDQFAILEMTGNTPSYSYSDTPSITTSEVHVFTPQPSLQFIRAECLVPFILCMAKSPHTFIPVAMNHETYDAIVEEFGLYVRDPSRTFFYCNPYSAKSASELLSELMYGEKKPSYWSASWLIIARDYGILYRETQRAIESASLNDRKFFEDRLHSIKAAFAKIIVLRLAAGRPVASIFYTELNSNFLDWNRYAKELMTSPKSRLRR